MFLEWDTSALALVDLVTDPDIELGWSFVLISNVDAVAGTIDLALAMPIGVPCNSDNGARDGGTIARLTFSVTAQSEPFGVRFRNASFPTSVGGPGGSIPVRGCNGGGMPSDTDRMSTELACDGLPGDADSDGDVDVYDFVAFSQCVSGPGGGVAADCMPFDFDADGDVDWSDAAAFQLAVPGT